MTTGETETADRQATTIRFPAELFERLRREGFLANEKHNAIIVAALERELDRRDAARNEARQ